MQKISTLSAALAASAFTAVLAVPLLAHAQKPAPTPEWKAEKCYGVNAVGKNDCASTGNNSCGGSAKRANDPKAWIYVPAGTCQKIQNASLQPK